MFERIKEIKKIHLYLGILILLTIPCYCLGMIIYWNNEIINPDIQNTATYLEIDQKQFTISPTLTFPVVTLTDTLTPTITPTFTTTITYVLPATDTPTPSSTPTSTRTHTPSLEPTETYTPTETLTPTASDTNTPIPSDTPG